MTKCDWCKCEIKKVIAYMKKKPYHPDCLERFKNENYWHKRNKIWSIN